MLFGLTGAARWGRAAAHWVPPRPSSGWTQSRDLGCGPSSSGQQSTAVSSRLLHRAKRRLLPVPMRSRIEAELTRLNVGGPPTISLVSKCSVETS